MQISRNGLEDLSYGPNLEVAESKKSEIMDFSEMLDAVKAYVEDGFIGQSEDDIFVSSISLQYYVSMDEQENITFIPVWNFCYPEMEGTMGMELEGFYIDARTGALVEYFF